MTVLVLTLNAGSSSVKFAAFSLQHESLDLVANGQIEGLDAQATFSVTTATEPKRSFAIEDADRKVDHRIAVETIIEWLEDHHHGARIAAVGHRIVHGGVDFSEPVIIDDQALAQLEALVPLAPLHQPHNLSGVRAARLAFPATQQVACFDTSFHRSHPFVADAFALPRSYYEDGIRRYGFHGLSYEYISRRLRALEPTIAAGRVIVAHLGNGASMCAMRDGRSIASTMGFTALDGLPMGTRCGQLDPGVVLYLMSERQMSAEAISDLLYKESGLKGMSGVSHDMRALEASEEASARDAIEYFVARIRREIGGLAATIGCLDALVFTGGIGENAARIRASVLSDMGWIGITLDAEANHRGAYRITSPDSRVPGFVIKTDEERMIAEHAARTAGLLRPQARFVEQARAL